MPTILRPTIRGTDTAGVTRTGLDCRPGTGQLTLNNSWDTYIGTGAGVSTVIGAAGSALSFFGVPAAAQPAAPVDLATTIAALQTLGLVGT